MRARQRGRPDQHRTLDRRPRGAGRGRGPARLRGAQQGQRDRPPGPGRHHRRPVGARPLHRGLRHHRRRHRSHHAQRDDRRGRHHAPAHRPRRLRLARALLRARRVAVRPPGRRLRDGAGLPDHGGRAGAAAALRRARLPARLRGPLAQPLPPLLRQPHLRQPAARGRLPGQAPGGGRGRRRGRRVLRPDA
ncbi:hypothetical protein SBRY_70027 [Actinacidiphila bryophytorum]|uniref:Uncharacterized protein n=1 Tax=Actinacidiphila bryophytorum TaxID=1436133 RepID=A0A9W4H683_9ACTN|nr:hypothetical protein SBRY_70027 [Actinacidiphila bryophytorum]